ncbi:DNA methyltransferase [Ureaplasma canigenitalium]|uniref:DNA methyltransferase n=1 Tax=Ureaplasma canigenitalium TaxID=42092 RepID=UPI001FE0624E|nr:site-specific DNA-methyltransferase [Ureaplasma canigenitalium]
MINYQKLSQAFFKDLGSITTAKKELKNLFEPYSEIFETPKPEDLIKRFLQISTNPGDIVLDFFLGSGTTAAVAHKMNRQYIGIEQMDYIENITVERLKKVIDGEQGGISKIVNWSGGGSFVYCELAKNGQKWIDLIAKATKSNIMKVKEQILSSFDIIPYLNKKEIEDALHNFDQYGLDDQKQRLISIINKNKLYVNYSEMDDESNEINESEKVFTNSFYLETN